MTKISDRSTTMSSANRTSLTRRTRLRRPTRSKEKHHQRESGRSSWSLQRAQLSALADTLLCLRSQTSPRTAHFQAPEHHCRPMHPTHLKRQRKNNRSRNHLLNDRYSNTRNSHNLLKTTAREAADAVWSCKDLVFTQPAHGRRNHDIEDTHSLPYVSDNTYDVTNFLYNLLAFSHCVKSYHTNSACYLFSDATAIPFVTTLAIRSTPSGAKIATLSPRHDFTRGKVKHSPT